MCDRISSVCRSAYLELRRIGSVYPFLTVKAAAELARSRILSRIDYCSSLLAGITSEQIARPQKNTKPRCPTDLPKETSRPCHFSIEETPLASCFRTHCLQTDNSFIPLLWWLTSTLPLLLSILMLILQISSSFLQKKNSDRPKDDF